MTPRLIADECVERTARMQWLCKAAGSTFIKAHAAAIAAACLQAEEVDGLAASTLGAFGLEIPYADVLAAAPSAARMLGDAPSCWAALWIQKGMVPDVPELARLVCCSCSTAYVG
jgi:hypothetical protein